MISHMYTIHYEPLILDWRALQIPKAGFDGTHRICGVNLKLHSNLCWRSYEDRVGRRVGTDYVLAFPDCPVEHLELCPNYISCLLILRLPTEVILGQGCQDRPR